MAQTETHLPVSIGEHIHRTLPEVRRVYPNHQLPGVRPKPVARVKDALHIHERLTRTDAARRVDGDGDLVGFEKIGKEHDADA